jgi:hypothetical protein
MANIIQLSERKRSKASSGHIIRKFIDGEFVEFVDFEMLSPAQQVDLLNANSREPRMGE